MYLHWYGLRHDCEEKSALTEHFLNCHPDEPMQLQLGEIIRTEGFVERKCMESVVQMTTESTINWRKEGAGTVGNLYL